MASITIYSTPTCAYCHMLMEWLKEKSVAFTKKDITVDEAAYHEAIAKAHQPVVPIVSIVGDDAKDETVIIGFDQPRIEKKLREVGLLK